MGTVLRVDASFSTARGQASVGERILVEHPDDFRAEIDAGYVTPEPESIELLVDDEPSEGDHDVQWIRSEAEPDDDER